jgi:hypothetical protein
MKVNLLNKVLNESKLEQAIDKYECTTNEESYLFMNQDTANTLEKQSGCKECELELLSKRNSSMIGRYTGHKVYINDDLEFGEVEIR